MSALPLPQADPARTTALGRPLLTVAEVADYLRVSEMTVYRLISSREIGATKIGRCWRVPADDLAAYVEDRHVSKAS
ncbi:helix-turn-helix domain-containing protein [Euzebya sp.]|uniref:helix-turn-helix domain-containing protein n=1 Tax=Euzebya sp. TaxID=1971409 RepID=UPI0035174AD1